MIASLLFLAMDPFGISKLHPTVGREWFSKWKGKSRQFTGVDPGDPWFDADHGDARYEVDGKGSLLASGPTVRMYVHDPLKRLEWSENLEITVYCRRINETKLVSYSGLQIFARTDHGTTGNENKNLCDDRGYAAKVTIDGRWEFEKEIRHGDSNGTAIAGTVRPWRELPVGQKVGVKFILRNIASNLQVKLEVYRDLTDGLNGGTWEKMTEFVDTGSNFGVGKRSPAPNVKPELALIRDLVLPSSENKKPMISVYLRHEFGSMLYEKFSIREI